MIKYASIWQNPSVKYGITGGLLTILVLIFYYMTGVKNFTDPQYSLVVFGLLLILNIALGIRAGLEEKQNNDGILEFKDAVFSVVITFVIVVVIYHAFYYLLFNFIDPSLQEETKQITIERLKETLSQKDANKEQIQKQIENIRNSSFTVFHALFLTFIFSLLSCVVALIIAAFIKKEPEA